MAAVAAASLFAALAVDGLWRRDAFDYAQIAREIVEGRGFSSRQIIYGLHLRFLEDHHLLDQSWPNLHRFPAPSLMIAGAFLVAGVGDAAVVGTGIACLAALAWLTFALGRSTLGGPAAAVAVLLLLANGVMLEFACSGLAEPALMLFFTAALACVSASNTARVPRAGWAVAAGACFGLAVLSRTNAILALPLLLGWIVAAELRSGRGLRAWRPAAGFFLAALAVTLPWLLRNQRVAGSPFFSLHSYFLVPSGPLSPETNKSDFSLPWVQAFVPPLEFARAHWDLVLAKWKLNVAALLRDVPGFGGVRLALPLALAGLFLPGTRRLRGVGWVCVLGFGSTALLVSFSDAYIDKYYFHFLPLLLLLAAGALWDLAGRLRWRGSRWPALLVALLVVVDLGGVRDAVREVKQQSNAIAQAPMEFIDARLPPEAIVFSDQSHAVTWLTGRRSIRQHIDRDADGTPVLAALRFDEEFLPIDAVYLSEPFLRVPWNRRVLLRNTRLDPRFRERWPARHRFDDGSLLYFRADADPAD